MKWRPFQHNSQQYDLTHLHPFPLAITQPAKGSDPERIHKFQVRFSLHCFATKPLAGDNPALAYKDNREVRSFCFDRYRLSFQLPDIIRQIHTKRCSHTGKGNFFLVEVVLDDGTRVEYEVYFDVNKPKTKGDPLELFVQSAYVRNAASKAYRHKTKKISFFVIAHNRKVEKPIKTPR